MARMLPIAARNGMEILGPPAPLPDTSPTQDDGGGPPPTTAPTPYPSRTRPFCDGAHETLRCQVTNRAEHTPVPLVTAA
jgi:hypothetical protein